MKKKVIKSLALLGSLVLSLFLVDRTIRFFIRADTCIDAAQWENLKNDANNCYVLYQRNGKTEVFQPPVMFSRSRKTHQGNDVCGTDITSLIPASHLSDPAKYLTDTYRGNLYVTCQTAPTATPIPQPTSTPPPPTPTATVMVTATATVIPSSTASPLPGNQIQKTVVSQPSPTPQPTHFPTPTNIVDTLLLNKTPQTIPEQFVPLPSPIPEKTLLSANNLIVFTKILDYIFFAIMAGVIIFWLVTILKPKPLPAKK